MARKPRDRRFDYPIYLVVRLVVCVMQALSTRQAYALADAIAALAYRVDKRHRLVAHENLKHAFGDRYDEAGRDSIVRGVYRHFFRMVVEMLQIPRKLHATTWRDRIELTGHREIVDRLLRGGPVILLSGHFGNWEMAGYLFGVFGFPPNSVARDLDNPHLDRFLRSFRQRAGQRMIPKKGGAEQMLRVLQSGRVLSMLADQDAGPRGLFVEFFGRPASTHKAIALLAIQHGAPIIVGGARRIGPGFRYEVATEAIIDPADYSGRRDDVRQITQDYTAALERLIRRSPEQYLWLHRRWKHQPKEKQERRAA